MTGFSLITSFVMTTFIAVLMYAMPTLIRSTLPLGVAVPSDRVDEPVVRRAVSRYRWVVVAAWVVSIAATFGLAFRRPAIAATAPVLLIVAIAIVGYAVCRTSILRAKRAGDWYEGASVRIKGSVTPESPSHFYGWFVASLVVLAVAAGVGIAVYPSLPDTVPIHWNGANEVDGWASKSVWSVFGVLLMGLGMVALFFALTFLTRLMPSRPDSTGLRASAQKRYTGVLLGQISLIAVLLIACCDVAGWLLPDPTGVFLIATVGMLVLLAAAIALYVVRVRRAVSRQSAPTDASGHPHEHPDDDQHWVLGLFYVNHEDPAAFVPKRFGIGWTVNLGSPIGKAIGIVLLLVLVGALAVPLLGPTG